MTTSLQQVRVDHPHLLQTKRTRCKSLCSFQACCLWLNACAANAASLYHKQPAASVRTAGASVGDANELAAPEPTGKPALEGNKDSPRANAIINISVDASTSRQNGAGLPLVRSWCMHQTYTPANVHASFALSCLQLMSCGC